MSADIALVWMISQMIKEKIISEDGFDMEYLRLLWQLNKDSYGEYKRKWAMGRPITTVLSKDLLMFFFPGRIDNSLTSFYQLTHTLWRTPDQYWETNGVTGRPTNIPCRGTNEHVHASVRIRIGLHGHGLDDHGIYKPPSLQDWICTGVDDKKKVRWVLPGHSDKSMDEDELQPLEIELMKFISPEIYDSFWYIQGSPPQDVACLAERPARFR